MGIASLIESVTMNDAEPCSLLHWLKSTREEIVSGYANSFTHQLSGSDAMSRQTVSFRKFSSACRRVHPPSERIRNGCGGPAESVDEPQDPCCLSVRGCGGGRANRGAVGLGSPKAIRCADPAPRSRPVKLVPAQPVRM